jgi:hypothetical protein
MTAHSGLAPQLRPHPGDQFLHVDRLREVVVGARLERRDAVVDVALLRHDDDRQCPGVLPSSQYLEQARAHLVGQVAVEQHRRDPALSQNRECLVPGRHRDRAHSRRAQHADEQRADRRVVVNDQNRSGSFLVRQLVCRQSSASCGERRGT